MCNVAEMEDYRLFARPCEKASIPPPLSRKMRPESNLQNIQPARFAKASYLPAETEDGGEGDDEDENDNESYGDYDGAGTKKFGARPSGKTETLAEVTPDPRKLKQQIGEPG